MANVVEIKTLLNGPRNIVLSIYLKSDGASGELVDEILFTPAEAGLKTSDRMSIQRIMYNFAGFDAVISFDAGGVDPNWKWVLSEGTNHPVDFDKFVDIKDDSGMDGTGNVILSTTGFTASQDQGSIYLVLKRY